VGFFITKEVIVAKGIYAEVYVKKAKYTYWVNEYMRQKLAGKSETTALRKSRR